MKKKSNWFWMGVVGAIFAVCLIWAGARLSGVSTPLPSFTLSPTESKTPVASATDTPGPTASVTPTAADTPAPTASEAPVASETPEASAAATPDPTGSVAPVVSDTPAPTETQEPPVDATTTPDPEETEEPSEVIGPIALVIMGDHIVDAVDLGAITESYTKVYDGLYEGESNTVEFVPGDVRVIEATCPDHVCIGQSWLVESMGGIIPVSCLPNGLAIIMVPVDDVQTPEVDGATN